MNIKEEELELEQLSEKIRRRAYFIDFALKFNINIIKLATPFVNRQNEIIKSITDRHEISFKPNEDLLKLRERFLDNLIDHINDSANSKHIDFGEYPGSANIINDKILEINRIKPLYSHPSVLCELDRIKDLYKISLDLNLGMMERVIQLNKSTNEERMVLLDKIKALKELRSRKSESLDESIDDIINFADGIDSLIMKGV